jgi:hypothetical protein
MTDPPILAIGTNAAPLPHKGLHLKHLFHKIAESPGKVKDGLDRAFWT